MRITIYFSDVTSEINPKSCTRNDSGLNIITRNTVVNNLLIVHINKFINFT